MLKLVGSRNMLGDRTFSLKDSIGAITPSTLSLPDNWYGGMVKKLYKTKEGLLLCADSKDNIINIAYEDIIPNMFEEPQEEQLKEEQQEDGEVIQSVAGFTPIQKGEINYESMEVHELKELAEKRGIEFFKNAKKDKMIELLSK